MEIMEIIALATAIVTFVLGLITKHCTKIENKKIPVQQLSVAVLSSILCSIAIACKVLDITYYIAILTCFSTVFVTQGIYDTARSTIETIIKLIKK